MTSYKQRKLIYIAINLVIIAICALMINANVLGLLPMWLIAGCTVMIFAHGLYYFVNYDEEEQSINFHVKEIAKGWSKALVNGMRLKNHR